MKLFKKIAAVLIFTCLIGPVLPANAALDLFFNSTEPGCVLNGSAPTNPNYVFCDDFERTWWALTCNNPSVANAGWLLCNGGDKNPSAGTGSAVCGGGGTAAGGTSCTLFTVETDGADGGAQLGLHGFYPNNTPLDEGYVRFYRKFSSGYIFNGNQKFFTFERSAFQGGIDLGGALGRDTNSPNFSPQWDCLDNDYRNPQYPVDRYCYIGQNQGNNITFVAGRWYYIEFYVKNNTYSVRNGLLKMWADDCGTSGLECTGAPTLRLSYTNIGWRGQGAGTPPSPNPSPDAVGTPTMPLLGGFWLDTYGHPADGGTIYVDQIIVSKAGPIGPMGVTGGGGAAPSAPSNLTVGPTF